TRTLRRSTQSDRAHPDSDVATTYREPTWQHRARRPPRRKREGTAHPSQQGRPSPARPVAASTPGCGRFVATTHNRACERLPALVGSTSTRDRSRVPPACRVVPGFLECSNCVCPFREVVPGAFILPRAVSTCAATRF